MNLLKSLVSISFITMFSRILGFIRDLIIASFFGIGAETDSFFIAFRLPNLLRRIFAEGAFSQAFIPILVEYKNNKCDRDTRIFISYISGLLILILTIITLIGILVAPWIIYIIAPGFIYASDNINLTFYLLRITFPYILFISLASLSSAILNLWNYFFIPAFTPTLLNISMIISVLLLSQYCQPSIIALAWGVFIGGILQLLYQLPFLYKIGMLVLPVISFYNKGIYKVIKLIIPALIGVSVSQISLIINTIFSSFLQSGSVSWMYYADRLMEFPIGVLGVALSTILLPALTKSFSIGNYKRYQFLIDWGLRLCFLLALPCAIILGILSEPLIISLFQYGNFTAYDVLMTKNALIAYSIGLIGFIIIKVLAPGFYSRKDTKTPVKIAIITLILTQLMNLIFIKSLKHTGLALSISLAACFNALMLYWKLRCKKIFIPLPGWRKFFLKLITSLTTMIIVLLLILNFMPIWDQGNMLMRIIRLLLVLFAGLITYFTTLFFFGFRLHDFSKQIN
ncbi:MAG: murein biosynthesis integral membrane protein MurJ [Arsenophonus endosymbiont of Ceratovacuna japonica]